MNPQMFNSFLDGTKSAIEMAAVANACGLDVPDDGLDFPPCGVDELADVLRPRTFGGEMDGDGMVEVVSSLKRDGEPVERDLRWGVYVVFKAPNDYAAACFKQYGLPTDSTGPLRGDVQAVSSHRTRAVDLGAERRAARRADRSRAANGAAMWRRSPSASSKAGEMLDGEGGYTVYGKLVPAARSLEQALPIGLAHHVKLVRNVAAGEFVTAADVVLDESSQAVRIRREMERQAQQTNAAVAAE